MKTITTTLVVISLSLSISFSQGGQFSQFSASPLTLNPAMTGVFNGDFRFTGIYRNQWGSFVTPFKTISASYDMHLFSNRLDNDIMGIGMMVLSDKAGRSELSTNRASLSLAYSKALSGSPDNFLVVGFQSGFVNRGINFGNLTFGEQYNNGTYDAGVPSGETFSIEKQNFVDISGGLMWYYVANNGNNVYAGLGVFSINQPKLKSLFGSDEQVFSRWVIHGGGQVTLSDRYALLPAAMFISEGPSQNINLGTFFRISTGQKNKTAFYFGGWYRFSDAFIPAIKLDYQNINLEFSYDMNTSSLGSVSKGFGGPEISLVYIGNFSGLWDEENKGKRMKCPTF